MTRWLSTTGILLLTLFAVTTEVQALNFTFPFPGSSNRDNRPPPGPGPWQYRPQDPSNARGVPPSYQAPPAGAPPRQIPGYQSRPGYPPGQGYQPGQGQGYQPGPGYQRGWPGQYGSGYGQQPSRQAAKPPRVELELSDHQPYVQENVLLKLRVVSDQNLDTATPEMPNSNDVMLHKIEGPRRALAHRSAGLTGDRQRVRLHAHPSARRKHRSPADACHRELGGQRRLRLRAGRRPALRGQQPGAPAASSAPGDGLGTPLATPAGPGP